MEKLIKNWKLFKMGVNVVDALNALETQWYNGSEGVYAIKSEKTGRFISPFDNYHENEKMPVNEIRNPWMIFVPDDEREKLTNEMAQLLKRSNWTDLTYQHIDHLDLTKMWKYVSDKIANNEKLIYKTMKWFLGNEIYKNK